MLISSAVKRSKAAHAKSAPLPVASHAHGGLPKAKVDNASAVLRGLFPQGFQEASWNGNEESVGENHSKTLQAWFQLDVVGVELQRKVWGDAFPGLGKATIESVLKKISLIKRYVLKKNKNATTGERMPPWVKDLLHVLKGATSSTKPPSKQGGGGLNKAPMPRAIIERQPEPAEEHVRHESPAPSDSQSAISIQSSAAPSLGTAAPSQVVNLSQPQHIEPAASSGRKRPAASLKKPAAKVQKASEAWKASISFGFVKATKAKSKSYIQSKPAMAEKCSCLVNVQAAHHYDHHQIVDKLMAFVCCEGGLDKAKVVEHRNWLMRGSR